MNGFIKIHRRMLGWEWYDNPKTKAVFLHLLLTANWKRTTYHGYDLNAGDVIIGRKKLASALGISERETRTALEHLKRSGEITTIKTTNKFTIIRVEKWAFYQGEQSESDQQNSPQSASQASEQRPGKDHTLRKKEEKNIRNPYFYNIVNDKSRPASERYKVLEEKGLV